jgi:pyruvate dehydrogenase phosphatase
MLRRLWKPIAAGVVVGSPAYLYYTSRSKFEFKYPVRDAEGNRSMATKRIPLLSLADADAILSHHAIFKSESRPNGLKWNYATAAVASNDPIEDANASQIVQRDEVPEDFLFFTVMDGHSGTHTSQLLSRSLIKAVAKEIVNTEKLAEKYASSSIFDYSKWFGKLPNPSDPVENLSLALQRAFLEVDIEITTNPVRLLMENMTEEMKKTGEIPDLSKHPMGLKSMQPALSGMSPPFGRISGLTS